MIHPILLVAGFFMVVWGVVICIMLIKMSLMAEKAILLVTIPGVLIVAVLALDFACHMLHLPHSIIPRQKQIVDGINWVLRLTIIPFLLIKLYEFWSKKRAKAVLPSETSL